MKVNIHIGVNINERRLIDYDGIESAGARNQPTDSQLVIVLYLPWHLSYFSLI